jgi:hypothetical protein
LLWFTQSDLFDTFLFREVAGYQRKFSTNAARMLALGDPEMRSVSACCASQRW